ncbi:MAG TPA: ribonuclease E/G, partial [Intrasporangium sp.]
MAPNETTPTESADEGITSRVAESGTMPYAAPLAPDDAAAPTGPAPRKRATRRTTKKAALAVDADVSPEVPSPDAADVDEETVPPVRKRATRKAAAPRKRVTKKAVVETSDDLETRDALESVAVTEASVGDDATATMAVETSEDAPESARPVVPSFSVLFQAPDTEAALSSPRRRRRAEAPAAAVPPRAPAGRDAEDLEEPEDQAD